MKYMKKAIKQIGALTIVALLTLPAAITIAQGEIKTEDKEIIESVEKGNLTDEELADLTILGIFGNGKERIDLFEKYDIDFDKVQDIVNNKLIKQVPIEQIEATEKRVRKEAKKAQKTAQKKVVNKTIKKQTTAKSTSATYSLRDLQFHGVINWGGYKFTYYSQRVLPGHGLRIPGRHVNSGGYVADKDGYIVVASNPSIPRGTVINTPFGYKAKVYDRCASCSPNWYDIYTK